MNKKLSVLGSTGSIGTQTLEIAEHMGFGVEALAANRNVQLLEEQARKYRPFLVAVYEADAASKLKIAVADLPVRVVTGMDGLLEAASISGADIVVNAVVGMVGLKPTLAALQAGKQVALANKETLVAGGALVTKTAREKGQPLLPVDSEHSAIFQCLQAAPPHGGVARILLTASGGPFFGKTAGELAKVTPSQALKHPNWSMGAKITIDSATMMNKGLEVIEAAWLFDLPQSKIDVVVHRESVIHSMVEFCDYSVLAQMGVPDMRIPIQYALTYPERYPCPVERLELSKYRNLSFYEPDDKTFPCLSLCRKAMEAGGLKPAAINGANEEAVALFLKEQISYPAIAELAAEAMERQPVGNAGTVEEILEADRRARAFVREKASSRFNRIVEK